MIGKPKQLFFIFNEGEAMSVHEIEELNIKIPEVGTKVKAKIVGMRKGKLGELMDVERVRNDAIRERLMRNANRDALQLDLEVGGVIYQRTMLWSLNPNSTMYKLIKKYGTLKVGMEIEVLITERGTPRIVI